MLSCSLSELRKVPFLVKNVCAVAGSFFAGGYKNIWNRNLTAQASRLSNYILQRSFFFFARMSCSEQSTFTAKHLTVFGLFRIALSKHRGEKKRGKSRSISMNITDRAPISRTLAVEEMYRSSMPCSRNSFSKFTASEVPEHKKEIVSEKFQLSTFPERVGWGRPPLLLRARLASARPCRPGSRAPRRRSSRRRRRGRRSSPGRCRPRSRTRTGSS